MIAFLSHVKDNRIPCGSDGKRVCRQYKSISTLRRYALKDFAAENVSYTKVEIFYTDSIYGTPDKVFYVDRLGHMLEHTNYPYECISKDKYPEAEVLVCRVCRSWDHVNN